MSGMSESDFINNKESNCFVRASTSELTSKLLKYDVISFDIYDTAILRRTSDPRGIFSIIASEMSYPEFIKYRNECELFARNNKYAKDGNKEVTIYDIYNLLESLHGIDKKWMIREIELEIQLSVANPYIKEIYDFLVSSKKTVVFTSNMYLPEDVVSFVLEHAGYTNYDGIYLSNRYGLTKEDGSLQRLLITHYGYDKKIVHIGDNYKTDVRQSELEGIDAIHYRNVKEISSSFRNNECRSPVGQIGYGLVNNKLHNGVVNYSEHWELGYRVGGLLSVGFCGYLKKLCLLKGIDKVLFCARDCEITYKTFSKLCPDIPSKYLLVSRFSLFNITMERSIYDFISRSFESRVNKGEAITVHDALSSANLEYLIDGCGVDSTVLLDSDNIEYIKSYLRKSKNTIIKHNADQIDGAKMYFASLIGDSKRILVVDLGWSGSCITMFKYFVNKHISSNITIEGALLYGNDSPSLDVLNAGGFLNCYVTSRINNRDIASIQYDKKNIDANNIFMEFLFASPTNSLIAYHLNEGTVSFEFNTSSINSQEITDVQKGIVSFAEEYGNVEKISPVLSIENINPYLATSSFYQVLKGKYYPKVFANYLNEKVVSKYKATTQKTFAESFLNTKVTEVSRQRILMVSPSFSYTGACYSLLRISKVLCKLGYYVEVWSEKTGDLIIEYKNAGVACEIVPVKQYDLPETIKKIDLFDVCIVNTIVMEKQYQLVSSRIPTIWFIREATNIPDFCKGHPLRMKLLKESGDLYCVSEYAAEYIRRYNPDVKILRNAVEDYSYYTKPKQSSKIRFIQMGTVEKRKGFDIFIDAYLALPKEYRDKAEVAFAGRCLAGQEFKNYWEPLVELSKKEPGVLFLGEAKGTRSKLETISQADVVVVASLDESCSLVALEGAMMSKPIIVTQNVGAKYMVSPKSGYIVDTGSVSSLSNAMMKAIDSDLSAMGRESRKMYEQYASMPQHEQDISEAIFSKLSEKKGTPYKHKLSFLKKLKVKLSTPKKKAYPTIKCDKRIIVSLTSFPGRIKTVNKTIESIINQTYKPHKIVLWLAKQQFKHKERDLPNELLNLLKKGLEIQWCEDYRSYKKLIPCINEYPEDVIVTADDDVYYPKDWLYSLVSAYVLDPRFIYCHRATKISLDDGKFDVVIGGKERYPVPSFLSKLTGVGGVLYPPGSLHKDVSNVSLFKSIAPTNDDLWFWAMAIMNDVRIAIVPNSYTDLKYVEGTQENFRLSRINDNQGLFWKDFNSIMDYYPCIKEKLLIESEEMKKYSAVRIVPDTEKSYSYYKGLNPDLYPYELALWFKKITGRYLDLNNPLTYNEKMQWLKLYAPAKYRADLSDKYLVRQWVKDKIGEQYLVPLLGVWDSVDDIDFEALPEKFAIKCNHGSGWNIIVTDKSKLNIKETKNKLNKWLHMDYAFTYGLELQYSLIQPKIIAEEYMENGNDNLYDYKFWCINGKVESIMFLTDRKTHLKMSFYDREWNLLPYVYNHVRNEEKIPKPDNLNEMIKLAETLASGQPHVRVDFYRLNDGRIIFGEMTFTSMSGVCKWDPPEWDMIFGKMIDIPKEMIENKEESFGDLKQYIRQKYGC